MRNGTSNEWLSERAYGICRVTLLPMYRESVPGSGMSSQLLFGELYQITRRTKDGEWLFAEGENQSGSGWILASQHQQLEEREFEYFSQAAMHVTTSPVSKLMWDKSPVYLLPGSQLHADHSELFDWTASFYFEGESRPFSKQVTREQLVAIATTFTNAPYLSGGRSIFGLFGGVGCSWFLKSEVTGFRITFLHCLQQEKKWACLECRRQTCWFLEMNSVFPPGLAFMQARGDSSWSTERFDSVSLTRIIGRHPKTNPTMHRFFMLKVS